MTEFENNAAELNKFREDLEQQIKTMRPQFESAMSKLQEMGNNMQPKYIKDTVINEHKAKITIFADNAIKIEFEDKSYGEKYYELCQ